MGEAFFVVFQKIHTFSGFHFVLFNRFEQENKGKNRWEPAQPLMDSNETSDEESGEESDEEEKVKSKE